MAQSANQVLEKSKATTAGDFWGPTKAATNVIHLLRNLPKTTLNSLSSNEIILNCVTNALDLIPEDTFHLNECLGSDTVFNGGVDFRDGAKFYFYALGGLTVLAKRVTKANRVYIKRRFHAFLFSDGIPKYWYPDEIVTEMYANLSEWQRFTDDNPKLRRDLILLVLHCNTTNTTFQNLLAQVAMVYSYHGMSVLKLMEEYSLSLPNEAFRLPHVQNDIERFKVALADAKEKIGGYFQFSYILNCEELSNLKHVDYPDLYLATAVTGKSWSVFRKNFSINRKIRPKSGTRVIQLAIAKIQPHVIPQDIRDLLDALDLRKWPWL